MVLYVINLSFGTIKIAYNPSLNSIYNRNTVIFILQYYQLF